MKNELISIVVPVYNSALYLNKCLESITNQKYDNLEIICVDDGSTDDSGAILDYFASNDKRIKAIHQANHGESRARNVGINMAQGEYIAFCDNDDWIESNMYETLVMEMRKNDLDIAASAWIREMEYGSVVAHNKLPVDGEAFGRDELLYYIYRRDDYQGFAYMWNKLYRRRLFEGVRFDESLRIGGDVVVLAEVALRVRSAAYIDIPFYHYRQLETSGSHTKNADKLIDWIKAYELVLGMFEKNHVPLHIMTYVKRFMAYTAERAAKAAIQSKDIQSYSIAVTSMKRYQREYEETNKDYPYRIEEFRNVLKWGEKNAMDLQGT